MANFIQELKSNKILTSQDIIRLRTYIKAKYPNSDVKQQADILINSIRKIIDKHLELIPVEQQTEVREDLLKNTLLSSKENILLYDLFSILTSTLAEKENASVTILDWVNSHLHKPINKDELLSYIPHIHENETPSIEDENDLCTTIKSEDFEQDYVIVEQNNFLSSEFNSKEIKSYLQPSPIKILFAGLTLVMCFLFISSYIKLNSVEAKEEIISIETESPQTKHPHLPEYFTYKNINESKLKEYLKSRNSLLEEEPYFSSIINTGREFDLNPLVLFAIAGHEQGFVPKSNPSATEIANNPFNVFVSWQEYNTDIVDSSQIAARTVINLSKDRPPEVDPFQWINRRYAEDQNWWKGVRSIFDRLDREVNDLSSN